MKCIKSVCMGFVMAAFLLGAGSFGQQKGTEIEQEKKREKTEGRLALRDLPKVVQATVQKETQGAAIVGISKENADGKTIYEIETKVSGRTRDMLIDDRGALTELEEENSLASLPSPIQAEIRTSIGKAKLIRLETVMNGAKVKTGYSALVELGGKQSEVEMGSDGKRSAKGK